jgi:hypothetical protein
MKLTAVLLFLLLVTSMAALAAPVTNTACIVTSSGSSITQTHVSTCNLDGPPLGNGMPSGQKASASISSSETMPSSGSASSISSSFTLNTFAYGGAAGNPASASASGDSAASFSTSGPVRIGIIKFSESNSMLGLTSTGNWSMSLGSLLLNCTLLGGSAGNSCTGDFAMPQGNGSGSLPFTLGQVFSMINGVSLITSSSVSPRGAGGSVGFAFQLFEADGTTLVQISSAPEPASVSLTLLLTVFCLSLVLKAPRPA